MQNLTAKRCICCSVDLSDKNTRPEQARNYIYKCIDCLKLEKRKYHAEWRAKHPGQASIVSKRHKQKLRATDPIKARARECYGDCRKRAIASGMECTLTPDFVLDLMRNATRCAYFGWPLTYEVGKERTLASLDRIDSSRGYTKDNVRVISYLANLMKSYATENELLMFARGVIKQYGDHDNGMLGLSAMRSVEKVKGAESNR